MPGKTACDPCPRRMPHVGPSVLALLVPALAACRTSLEEFDRLARTGEARTIVYEQDFSLYSPFSLNETREWLQMLEAELVEVAALLEVDATAQRERAGPLIVELREVEGLKPMVTVVQNGIRIDPAPEQHPLHGIEGFSGERAVVVFVEAARTLVLEDGRTLRGTWQASEFRSTLRHELAHALASSAGIEGDSWLEEGAAVLVEYTQARSAAGGAVIAPHFLRYGRRRAREAPALVDLLVVQEDLQGIATGRTAADPTWRPRLLAFFAFLLERELARGGDLRSTIDGAQRAGREELVRLEPEWRTWLEPGPLDDTPKADDADAAEPAPVDAG